MNEIFFIPGAICSIFTIGLYNIKKIGNKLVLWLFILLCLSNLAIWPVYMNSEGWNRLGYGILAYISAVCLLSSFIALVLQKQMNRLYMIIIAANILVLIFSIVTAGISTPESRMAQSILYINSISGGIYVIYIYFRKFIFRNLYIM